MIILRNKYFSSPSLLKREDYEKQGPKDAVTMTQLGRTGLQLSAGLGGLAAIETGRSMYHGAGLLKEKENIIKLKNNKEIRNLIKNNIKKHSLTPEMGENLINKIRWVEKNSPKFSLIDKIQRGLNLWNKSSKINRTVLNNADTYSKIGIDNFIKNNGRKMSKEEIAALNRVPKIVKKIGKMGVALKNAKGLGKTTSILGSASGLLYLNGRNLQEGKGKI